ncbi:hypothetical protein ACFSTA_10930 [Ornithinibacillus salinisoli]|uniref:Type 4a pilus biogenesis protein PilO n=1 Tax=Ornithinibacillus salinisoli TaxID=1848459 RepID=A0ABW4W7L3_9BACI
MNNLFQENRKILLLLLGLLFLLLLVIFFFFFQPNIQELKSKEGQLRTLENEVANLGTEIENMDEASENENNDLNSVSNKIPMNPAIEGLILTLQEIERISGSSFENISFSYGGTVAQRMVTEEETEEIKTGINLEEKPDNLEVISITITVTSPDYEHFHEFIKQIEEQERLMTVSSLNFQKPAEKEIQIKENQAETITSNVTISTFYYKK